MGGLAGWPGSTWALCRSDRHMPLPRQAEVLVAQSDTPVNAENGSVVYSAWDGAKAFFL